MAQPRAVAKNADGVASRTARSGDRKGHVPSIPVTTRKSGGSASQRAISQGEGITASVRPARRTTGPLLNVAPTRASGGVCSDSHAAACTASLLMAGQNLPSRCVRGSQAAAKTATAYSAGTSRIPSGTGGAPAKLIRYGVKHFIKVFKFGNFRWPVSAAGLLGFLWSTRSEYFFFFFSPL